MRRTTRVVFVLFLAVAMAASLSAQEQKKKKPDAPKGKTQAATVASLLPEGVRSTLTDDQKTQIAELDKQYGGKLAAMRKARAEIITVEKRKAMAEARKDKKGAEGKAAADALLSAEEQEKLKALAKEHGGFEKEVRGKLMALLTEEQKSKVRGPGAKPAAKPGETPKKKRPEDK